LPPRPKYHASHGITVERQGTPAASQASATGFTTSGVDVTSIKSTRLLPDRDPADLAWGYEWALGAFLMHLGNDRIKSVSRGRAVVGDVGSQTEALIRFVCAGLRSVASKKLSQKGMN